MKRSVILTLCIILCLALTLGGTIAYLSDYDGDVNVMTLGQVKIEVEEFQRDGNDGLADYKNGQFLYPQVGENDTNGSYGLPTNPTFHDKIVRVRSNARNANAYLRVWIGVPTAMLNVNGEKAVHLVLGDGVMLRDESPDCGQWIADQDTVQTEVDNVPYTMFLYHYNKLLAPGEVTGPVLAGLYLDKRVDNGDNPADGYTMWIDGKEYPIDCDLTHGLQVTVLAQAVQADGFDNAKQAFAEAGMDDPTVFDEELDLVTPVEEFTQQIKNLLDSLAFALENPGSEQLAVFQDILADLESQWKDSEITEEEYESQKTEIEEVMAIIREEAHHEVSLQSGTYDLNAAAAAALNAMAENADQVDPGNGDTPWQKQVRLLVKQGEQVEFNLDESVELADNLVIVNDGGTLTIIGPNN